MLKIRVTHRKGKTGKLPINNYLNIKRLSTQMKRQRWTELKERKELRGRGVTEPGVSGAMCWVDEVERAGDPLKKKRFLNQIALGNTWLDNEKIKLNEPKERAEAGVVISGYMF